VKLIKKTAVIGVSLLLIVNLLGLTRGRAERGADAIVASLFANEHTLTGATERSAMPSAIQSRSAARRSSWAHGSTISAATPIKARPMFFKRQGASWVEAQKLTASDALFDFFGISVAVSGSTLIVGAENGGNIKQGSAYIFER